MCWGIISREAFQLIFHEGFIMLPLNINEQVLDCEYYSSYDDDHKYL